MYFPPLKKKPKQENENKYTVKKAQLQYPPKLTTQTGNFIVLLAKYFIGQVYYSDHCIMLACACLTCQIKYSSTAINSSYIVSSEIILLF